MNIIYTCDNNYVWLMSISMISLFENNRAASTIEIYLLGDGISCENAAMISEVAIGYGREVHIIDTSELSIPEALCSERWPKSAYARLYSGELLPASVHDALYLDCDTVVLSDLEAYLNGLDTRCAFTGVMDCVGASYKTNIGLLKEKPYINAGVLYIDLDRLRGLDPGARIERFLTKYSKRMSYADQDVLNGAFSDSIATFASPDLNVTTQVCVYTPRELKQLRSPNVYYEDRVLELAVADPAIVHYTTCMLTIRPWFCNSDHPYRQYFEQYKSLSPFVDIHLNEMHFSGMRYKVFSVLSLLPRSVQMKLLGFLHTVAKPISKRFNSWISVR